MTVESCFPKDPCNIYYASEFNTAYYVAESGLETAMNIAALQYSDSVSDIDHDYMLVDIMTDATGYNNTVCDTDTTSKFCGTALTGNYRNACCKANAVVGCLAYCYGYVSGCTGGWVICKSDYGLRVHVSEGGCNMSGYAHGITCIASEDFDEANDYLIEFKILCFINRSREGNGGGDIASLQVCGSHDNYSCCITGTNDVFGITNCYCYKKASTNCWDFYKNGTCLCQVTMSAFPNIIFTGCGYIESGTHCSRSVYAYACMSDICEHCIISSKVVTEDIDFGSEVSQLYITDEVCGTGTTTYNVVNPTGGACLCTGLTTKCNYAMDCCLCSLRFEIVQCDDDVSCVKSYAMAVVTA